MSVTVCLVTRNHAASLERAVRSAGGLATEVVVADTGSTDGTVEVGVRLGAKVVPVAWADDFAAACNAALDAATGDWVFWLNPDETLAPDAGPVVAAGIADRRAFGLTVRVQQELRADRPGYGSAGREERVFRRDPAVRWHGRLHPRFAPPLEEVAAARGLVVGHANATVHRHAYLSAVTPDKLRWTVRLLEAELRDRPGQLPYLIEYGRHLLWLEDARGHEVLAEAAEQVRAVQDAPRPPTPWVGQLFEYLLAVSPRLSRSRLTRDEVRVLAARWFPRTPPVLWALANERYAARDYPAAVSLLNQLLEVGRSGTFDSGGGFDPGIGPLAYLRLAWCHLHGGNWLAAKTCVAGLLADPEYRDRAAQVYAAADRETVPAEAEG